MRDPERVEFCSSRLFCINIRPRFDRHSRDLMGVYLRLHRWCVCVLRSPCWVLQSVGSGLGRRLNVVAPLMPILRTHNKRHPSQEPATECNRVGSTLCRLTASLQGMLGNHEKDKNTLITTKAKLKVVNKEVEEVRWSHEVLQQKYNQVKSASTNPI